MGITGRRHHHAVAWLAVVGGQRPKDLRKLLGHNVSS